jgi:hypothetical protein
VNPYQGLGDTAFWATAVAQKNMFDIGPLWVPKFALSRRDKVVTFGSCFAQHFGKALAAKGFRWLDAEPAPGLLSAESAAKFNYGTFSARTGNIYTVPLLRQWVAWAKGETLPPEEVWEQDGQFYDPFRPNIEPNGFADAGELLRSRAVAIAAFRTCLTDCNVFVFTLGLTESWSNAQHGYVYPMCPGTVAGAFDATQHKFVNQDYQFVRSALTETLAQIRTLNHHIKFLLTVSPVPLTATMSGQHVLVATMESKSILRAVAGSVARENDDCDYFPSFEIINSPAYRGMFFEANQRNVSKSGVAHVMMQFFDSMNARFPFEEDDSETQPEDPEAEGRETLKAWRREFRRAGQRRAAARAGKTRKRSYADEVCEEELLAAFAKQTQVD